MRFGDIIDLFAMAFVIAGITAVVQSENSARIIRAWTGGLSEVITASLGNRNG